MAPAVTVVLPCAGSGTRMGLPFPKELAPLGPGRVLIDSCLDLIAGAAESSPVRVLLMDDGMRGQTEHWIRRRLPDVPLARVRQDPDASDMTDAVLRLEPWLGPVNVLLLPDAVYEAEGDPVGSVAGAAKSFGFAFGAVRGEPADLAGLGALQVRDDRVQRYEDKPPDPRAYDAAWVMLGFTGGTFGLDGLRVIAQSASRERTGTISDAVLRQAPVTWVKGYRDCGTWEAYAAEAASR